MGSDSLLNHSRYFFLLWSEKWLCHLDNTNPLRSPHLCILASRGHVCLFSQYHLQDGEMASVLAGRGTQRHTSHRHPSSSLTQNPKLAKSSSHQLVRPWLLSAWWVTHKLLLLRGGHFIAALLVLLYQGELLWKSRRAQFPPETTVISVLYIQTSAFIAGGGQHYGCV